VYFSGHVHNYERFFDMRPPETSAEEQETTHTDYYGGSSEYSRTVDHEYGVTGRRTTNPAGTT